MARYNVRNIVRGFIVIFEVQQRVTIITYPRTKQKFFIWKILIEY